MTNPASSSVPGYPDPDTMGDIALLLQRGEIPTNPMNQIPRINAQRQLVDKDGQVVGGGVATYPDYASRALLARLPTVTTPESITVALGPTGADGATIDAATTDTQYNALRANKRELSLDTPAKCLAARNEITFMGVYGFQDLGSGKCTLRTRPAPIPAQTPGWQGVRSGVAFWIDGANEVSFVYGRNAANSIQVFVDGFAMPGADASGRISNGVLATANRNQWTTLSFPDRRERLVYFQDNTAIESIIVPAGATLRPYVPVGRMIIFGDSFAGWTSGRNSGGSVETPRVHHGMAAAALQSLGYDVLLCNFGGTGFINDGGGFAQSKHNYETMISLFAQWESVLTGADRMSITDVLFWGTGNDNGSNIQQSDYERVMSAARAQWPNARPWVTTVYEGFNTVGAAAMLNARLVAAANASGVAVIGVDSVYNPERRAVFSGTGSNAAPAYDGNADWALSGYGTDGRHPSTEGTLHGARFYAKAAVQSGMQFKVSP